MQDLWLRCVLAFAALAVTGCGQQDRNGATEPDKLQQILASGVEALQAEDYPRAINRFTEVTKLDSNSVDAFINRGAAWYETEEYAKAVEDYSESIRLMSEATDEEPDTQKLADALVNRGLARQARADKTANSDERLSHFVLAISDYSEALVLVPDDAEVYSLRGDCWYQIGQHDRALGDYALADVTELIQLGVCPRNTLPILPIDLGGGGACS